MKEILSKKNKARSITLSGFKLYHKAAIIETVWYWPKTDTETLTNGTEERVQINTNIYSKLIFDKGGKNTQWGKDSVFNKMVLEKLDSNIQNKKLDPYLTPKNKIKHGLQP